MLRDFETSQLDRKHKALFRYLAKLAGNSTQVSADDIVQLKEAGWSEEAIYDALSVAAVFQFYNTWINGAGVEAMSSADYIHSGTRLRTLGYCMDFSLKGLVKYFWTAWKRRRRGATAESIVSPTSVTEEVS